MKKFLLGLLLFWATLPALAQGVQQTGTVTPGHAAMWTTNGVLQDAGTAANGFLTSLGITNAGGPGLCLNSGPITGAYNQSCFSVTTNGGLTISSFAVGGATTPAIKFNVNGTLQGFPTVVGLPVTSGDSVCFNDTSGTLKDCLAGPSTISLPITLTGGAGGAGATVMTLSSQNNSQLIFTGSGNNVPTSFFLGPTSGTIPGGVIGEYALARTSSQAFGTTYARWSFGALGTSTANQSGFFGESGDSGETCPPTCTLYPGGNFVSQSTVESPVGTFTTSQFWTSISTPASSYAEDAQLGATLFGQIACPFTVSAACTGSVYPTVYPINVISLVMPNRTSQGTQDSNSVLWEGKSCNTNPCSSNAIAAWWRQKVNVTSNVGASTFQWQRNLNGAGWTTSMALTSTDGLGLGGTPPTGGILIYTAPVTPGGNGQASIGASSTGGTIIYGQGSSQDISIANKGGTVVASINTGATVWNTTASFITNGLGVGTAAPSTGIQVSGSAVSPGSNGIGSIGSTSTQGMIFEGQGSAQDYTFLNKNGQGVASVTTGSTTFAINTLSVGPGNTNNTATDGTVTSLTLNTFNNAGGSPSTTIMGALQFQTAQGTAASPANSVAGDWIGRASFAPRVNGAFTISARINAVYNDSGTNTGTYMSLYTTPIGSASIAEAVRVQGSGAVSIGTTTDPGIGSLLANKGIGTVPTVVGSLPTCNAGYEGQRAYVTDQNTAVAYRGAVTGSGSTRQAVLCSNSAWIQD